MVSLTLHKNLFRGDSNQKALPFEMSISNAFLCRRLKLYFFLPSVFCFSSSVSETYTNSYRFAWSLQRMCLLTSQLTKESLGMELIILRYIQILRNEVMFSDANKRCSLCKQAIVILCVHIL